jgi:hypothetical protein
VLLKNDHGKDQRRKTGRLKKHLVLESGTRERLNMLVNGSTKAKLEWIAFHYGVTKIEVIERLLAKEENTILESLTSMQAIAYYDRVTR